MPAKKQPTAMDSTTRQAVAKRTGMKKLGDFYAGKGAGSADAAAGRGAARRSATYKMAASEGPRRKAVAKKPVTRSGQSAMRGFADAAEVGFKPTKSGASGRKASAASIIRAAAKAKKK